MISSGLSIGFGIGLRIIFGVTRGCSLGHTSGPSFGFSTGLIVTFGITIFSSEATAAAAIDLAAPRVDDFCTGDAVRCASPNFNCLADFFEGGGCRR